MRTQIRTLLLTGLLSLGLATGLQAQDKYEFATVRQVFGRMVEINVEGKPTEAQELPKGDKRFDNFFFGCVSKLQDEGWEVFNSHEMNNQTGYYLTFILRRKKG